MGPSQTDFRLHPDRVAEISPSNAVQSLSSGSQPGPSRQPFEKGILDDIDMDSRAR